MPVIGVISITALAGALRILALGKLPPGLYHDEAFNGLDALQVLEGQWPVYFAANHGREPLFIYLIALTLALLGRTPGALRLAAAICGTLTIPVTYLLARAWFNRRVGLLSAAILACTLWHVHLSRVGFRAVTLPLTTALALWLGTRAYRSHRRSDWLISGLVYGLCFYAYLPARLTPIALALFALYLLATGKADRLWPGTAWFVVGTLIVLTPLTIYTLGHWDVVMGRPGKVWALNPLVSDGGPVGTLGRQLVNTMGMFFVRGDAIPRHNLPGRAVFDPLLGIAMLGGVGWAVWRRRTAHIFAFIWVGWMLVPTWLAEDAPHFLRAVGVLPLLTIFPALGLEAASRLLEQRRGRRAASAAICVVLSISLCLTVRDYFMRYARDPQVAYAFESAAAQLAAESNRFTGVGWDGSGLVAQRGAPNPNRQVYLDDRLWEEWEAVPFLVPQTEGITILSVDTAPPPSDAERIKETLLLTWPYEGLGRYQAFLPRHSSIEAHGGEFIRGDLEQTPYEAYVSFTAVPPVQAPSSDWLGRFDEQIALIGCSVQMNKQTWDVTLEWKALLHPERDYTVFVHLRDGEQILSQDDSEPATGHYPTSLWREGDIVIDTHTVTISQDWKHEPRIVVGLYTWPTMERLEAEPSNGGPPGDELIVYCQVSDGT